MPESEPFAATLGEIIRQQREISALPMRQLAKMVGISNPYLSQIERGLREPSEHVLQSIASSLQTTVDDLTGRDDESAEVAVLDAIAEDATLTAKQRQALAEVYRSMVAATAAKKASRRKPAAAS